MKKNNFRGALTDISVTTEAPGVSFQCCRCYNATILQHGTGTVPYLDVLQYNGWRLDASGWKLISFKGSDDPLLQVDQEPHQRSHMLPLKPKYRLAHPENYVF